MSSEAPEPTRVAPLLRNDAPTRPRHAKPSRRESKKTAGRHARHRAGSSLPAAEPIRTSAAQLSADDLAEFPTQTFAAVRLDERAPDDRPDPPTANERLPRAARHVPRRRVARRASRSTRLIRLLVVAALTVLIATGTRAFVFQMFFIPSASMEPTLCGGTGCSGGNDRIIVDKVSYRVRDVSRGDVVIFGRPPALNGVTDDQFLVKRVVAIAGDRVRWDRGSLWINDVEQHEPYVEKSCQSHPSPWIGQITVPADDVFVMGDNRCNSEDSRAFGPITQSTIVGRAMAIVWPFNRVGGL